MIVRDLIEQVFDTVVLYKEDVNVGEYIDLYKGDIRNCNEELLRRKVRSIGAKKVGVLDIRVE